MLKKYLLTLLLLTVSFSMPFSASAHNPGNSYLFIKGSNSELNLRWDIALNDLQFVLSLDSNLDQKISWKEVKQRQADITAFAYSNLLPQRNNKPCELITDSLQTIKYSDGAYVVINSQAECEEKHGELSLKYSLLFDENPQHRGIIFDRRSKNITNTYIASIEENEIQLKPNASHLDNFMTFIKQGVWHILIGLDHVLFIITLMLPAVLVYQNKQWQAVEVVKPALFSLLKVVTAFTIAHSITLTLATLDIVSLPSRWVESAIALSVILVCINNIRPLFTHARWSLAFIFGLIHGFGFASVLNDLNLEEGSLILSLLGFNVGVEVGQQAILALIFPMAYIIRKTNFYLQVALRGGSISIALLASVWLVQRSIF